MREFHDDGKSKASSAPKSKKERRQQKKDAQEKRDVSKRAVQEAFIGGEYRPSWAEAARGPGRTHRRTHSLDAPQTGPDERVRHRSASFGEEPTETDAFTYGSGSPDDLVEWMLSWMEPDEVLDVQMVAPELLEGMLAEPPVLWDSSRKDVLGALRSAGKMQLPSGARSSGSGWALGCVRSDAIALAATRPDLCPGGKYTIHHKISQSRLLRFAGLMKEAGAKADAVREVLTKIRAHLGSPDSTDAKALLNMPANLEVGPPTDLRAGDPGAGFDPTAGSPRSTLLGRVEALMGAGSPDWDEIAHLLKLAHGRHTAGAGRKVLSTPDWKQWTPRGGKFVRDK